MKVEYYCNLLAFTVIRYLKICLKEQLQDKRHIILVNRSSHDQNPENRSFTPPKGAHIHPWSCRNVVRSSSTPSLPPLISREITLQERCLESEWEEWPMKYTATCLDHLLHHPLRLLIDVPYGLPKPRFRSKRCPYYLNEALIIRLGKV